MNSLEQWFLTGESTEEFWEGPQKNFGRVHGRILGGPRTSNWICSIKKQNLRITWVIFITFFFKMHVQVCSTDRRESKVNGKGGSIVPLRQVGDMVLVPTFSTVH